LWDFWCWAVLRASSNKANKNIFLLFRERFDSLSNLFLDQIYPHISKLDNNNPSFFILDAVAYNESCIISSSLFPDLSSFINRVNSDIKTLNKNHYPPTFLIYLVGGSLFDNSADIIRQNAALSKNSYRVIIYDERAMEDLLIRSAKHPPSRNNFSLLSRYESLYDIPRVEHNVIEEIFSSVNSTKKDMLKIPPFENAYLKLKNKIEVNFKYGFYNDVKLLFRANWSNKVIVEEFIKLNFHRYESQLYAILGLVQNHFIGVKENFKGISDFPINNPMYFESLAQTILPSEKKVEPRYLAAAKAIILFFFEYCDFGRKTNDDPLSLFNK